MFTRLGLPMNRYTFVYFRKPKRFRAQMHTRTHARTHTHTHLDPPMHFDFPERMCMHQSLSLYICKKRFGSRSDPNGIQERMFRQFKNLCMR